jgi:addiction module HigA family antidote
MATATNSFRPDYAVPPGWILEERLEAHGVSHAEFARRCGRSAKLISEIIAGKASIEPETALQFEKVLGVDAGIWLGVEADYRLHRARAAEAERAGELVAWYRQFPVKNLIEFGAMEKPASPVDGVSKLLAFFGVASVDAWQARYGAANVAYRHSPSFRSSEQSLATWLRLGEIAAEQQECAAYNETRFKGALKRIRRLTTEPIEAALPETRMLCNEAGVALVLTKSLPKTALCGAARWLSPTKAVIQLSLRHGSDDHFWFSLFHEAAHLLLHSKRAVFVDGTSDDVTELEAEADEWAANVLVPRQAWETFKATRPGSVAMVRQFAQAQDIAPGIVVGMLQHAGMLPWTHLNHLKVRYRWEDD